jgi:hypothetical protein
VGSLVRSVIRNRRQLFPQPLLDGGILGKLV